MVYFERKINENGEIMSRRSDILMYILRLSERLKLSTEVNQLAIELLFKNQEIVKNHSPKAIACALIYIASTLKNEKRSQKEIGDALKVSEQTIRKIVKEIKFF